MAEREYLRKRTTRTIYGNAVQTALALKFSHEVVKFTTLNEKLQILADTSIGTFERPVLMYFAIGMGGHSFKMGVNDVPLPTAIEHEVTDAALYKQIPLVLRLLSNDLTKEERARYRLRKITTINGVQYAAYYGRLLDTSATVIHMTKNQRDNNTGVISSVPFTPKAENLNPQPPVLDNSGTIPASDTYMQVSAEVDLSMNSADLAELRDVARILFNDESYAMVSEWALFSGTDVTHTGEDGVQYTEVIGAQINDFVTSGEPRTAENTAITMRVNLGASDPLLAQSSRTTTP